MPRRPLPTLLVALALAATGCDTTGPGASGPPTEITLTAEAEALINHSNAFGVGLFAEVAATDDRNLMLSPLSASVALTMLLNGTDGDTYAQIRDMLGYAPDQDLDAVNAAYQSLRTQLLAADPEVQFALANAVFYDQAFDQASPVKAPFLAAMRGPFDATVQSLDFGSPSAPGVINGWASDHTEGRVPKVIEEIGADLVLVLMNALYFKGDWSAQFDPARTTASDFTLADGRTVQTPIMTGLVPALTVRGDGYSALELPYGRANFSFVVLMPDDAGLADFARQLDAGFWADATTRLDAAGAFSGVEVGLPRFSFTTDKFLNDQLKALGMVDAFGPAADLSRMSDAGLYVDFVKQNTFLRVDEEGSEAAAVTTVGVALESAGPSFYANRPFVFAIRERTTDTLLFIGQVADPRS
ncbi:serpin family protein [Rubrivirga sp.]|uniref:serpin family protein n=1 Tax=Rubrivirga sp. TaxID=1885344 RepID=UPI003B51EE9A